MARRPVVDERDDDATGHAAAAILCWFETISVAGPQTQASRPSASRRLRQTRAGRPVARRVVSAVKFAASELIPQRHKLSSSIALLALVIPAARGQARVVGIVAVAPSVASRESDPKKFRIFSPVVKLGRL